MSEAHFKTGDLLRCPPSRLLGVPPQVRLRRAQAACLASHPFLRMSCREIPK